MSLTGFKIENNKAITLAECTSIPNVMIIAGPNGVGKSTLLYALSQQTGVVLTGQTTFLYQPPHRAIRRTTVQRRRLTGGSMSMLNLLSQGTVPGFEGFPIQNPSRAPDNVDEAGSMIKYTLGRIENKRQTIITKLYDQSRTTNASIEPASQPEIFSPLKELTKYLLPQLSFERIDFENEDNIRCIWKRKDASGDFELDIDDLSSGEKAIIILFLPLLENDIDELLKRIEGSDNLEVTRVPLTDRILIIDEPELHLHPDLQARILSYIRNLSNISNIQFILSTHSPTILDQALDEELFLFSSRDGAHNQLRKVASNLERLEALKQIAGDAYLLTTGRSIVCIEGVKEATTNPTDIRLLEILYPRSTAYTFIPTGGKGNVITMVEQLRSYLPEEHYKIKVYGLVDRDQTSSRIQGIFPLPVCMIENLLLDPVSIFAYLRKKTITGFLDQASVDTALSEIVEELFDEEVSLRVMILLKPYMVRLKGSTVEEIVGKQTEAILKVTDLVSDQIQLEADIQRIKTEIRSIVSSNNALKFFRGKSVIKNFHSKYVANQNISYSKFCYELAEVIEQTGYASQLLTPIFDGMENVEHE